ncbi:putative ribonuclease H-like domain-containing protein [Tanacetum coccineum]
MVTQSPKVDRKYWNGKMTQKLRLGFGFTKKACFVCGSHNYLIKDYDFHEKIMPKDFVLRKGTGHKEVRPIWNNTQRINHQNKFVPTAVLTRSGRIPVSTAKQNVNTATPKNRVNVSKSNINTFPKSHSPIRRPFYKSTVLNTRVSKEKVNTVRVNGVNTAGQTTVSTVKGNGVTAVKALAGCVWRPKMTDLKNGSKDNSGSWISKRGNPQQALKYKGMFDSGCSRHMTGNKALLTDYHDINGGFVAFGGSTSGGKITGIGKIRTNKIDFEDVFFVKELKFNLFSVSQMCDKKNNVLFTETECLVLSPDFKLIDESQVLLRVPRQNNMYIFDLKNVVPSGDLTCLFAKATIDESKLWHRRLGHVNFKTMNKLVKGNLVRGLPSKTFENDHTCVACQKGKQHKASCKTKHVSSISQPLQMLHMDLFGPTSVRSINHKTYCLVVTDDFSRFSWVFFLATKSETSGILKKFITNVKNQLNHKVKVIMSDNGTKFKNREMDEFCGQKGIKRECSVARTPQQNGVAERKNITLIEATRTMLADSLLPTVFWAKAVNTACYVLNRVLVTKPHNKTPYELIIGRAPSISFMRPFGCPVTILNTLDPLGKFNGKVEEGFLVGYSVHSKAFRVFNTKTRKVEDNFHVNFLENKPNVAGQGPNWLFDIDSLTNSMNYQPVTAGNQTNKNAGPQETNGNTGLKKNVDAGQTEEENVSTQQYIVFPLWSSISSNYKSSDDKAEDDTVDDDACKKTVQEPASEYDQALKNVLDKMMDQEKEATEQSDAVRKEFEAQCDSQLLQEKITRASSTNSFNTVSTPVNTASASRTFSPVGPSSGPSFVPFGGSFPIDVANLPHDPLMPELEDTAEIQSTGIFGNAYDDHDLETLNTPYADQSVGAEADFNNMEPSTIAVNTACYVLNRVLVTKPHNKTPYELIIGRAPSISFMRPFGCPVTILNTLDPLGKFDGKAEEGFLVGYSVNSKAFRVFNTETRKVEENLHVNFLENKPNVAGQGPNWLFDIDSLTNSMNYQPVTAGNQTNKNAGPQETNGNTDDKAEDDTVNNDAYKKTVQEPASEYDQALKNVLDKMMDQEKEATKQSDVVRKEFEAQCDSQLLQEKIIRANSTNSFNTVSTPVNTASASRTFSPVGPLSRPSFIPFGRSFLIHVANIPHDPLMPELEDTAKIRSTGIFGNAYDDHDLETLNTPYADQSVGAKVDFNNMEPSIVFSHIPTTRVHSIHLKAQIIGDPKSAVQTRGMTKKNSREHVMISYIQKQKRTYHKDF